MDVQKSNHGGNNSKEDQDAEDAQGDKSTQDAQDAQETKNTSRVRKELEKEKETRSMMDLVVRARRLLKRP